MPLSLVISQQLHNSYCPVLNMSMNGHLTASSEEGGGVPVSLFEATSGKFLVTFLHPEATSTEPGKQFLRSLAAQNMIKGLFVDEVHQVFHPPLAPAQNIPLHPLFDIVHFLQHMNLAIRIVGVVWALGEHTSNAAEKHLQCEGLHGQGPNLCAHCHNHCGRVVTGQNHDREEEGAIAGGRRPHPVPFQDLLCTAPQL